MADGGVADGLRSGQLAAAAGVNQQTLRYYERRGLIPEPVRTLGGHRLYPPETVTLLRAIKTAQRLGFSLAEVVALLAAARRPNPGGGPVSGHGIQSGARAKLAEVEQKIFDLVGIRDTLRRALAAGCDDLVACAGDARCPLPSR
ncbi:MerR family transcriptional regulator [Plantactinospora solaniradicis]|uniref:MerR family transcriptional regulator n=1 Tax=Plantactinospora solaniradicis TaxID=1723736 RepID=A0ABW1KR23_9ACTN